MKLYRGYSVIEVLLAGSILALAVSGIVISLVIAQRTNQANIAQEQAMNMAEQGIEAIRSIRNKDYNLLVNGTDMALAYTGGDWSIITSPTASDDTIDNRTRRITIANGASNDEKTVTVTISYRINPEGDIKTLTRTEAIANLYGVKPIGVTAESSNYRLLDDIVGDSNNTFIRP